MPPQSSITGRINSPAIKERNVLEYLSNDTECPITNGPNSLNYTSVKINKRFQTKQS